jgi:hypothetical protein
MSKRRRKPADGSAKPNPIDVTDLLRDGFLVHLRISAFVDLPTAMLVAVPTGDLQIFDPVAAALSLGNNVLDRRSSRPIFREPAHAIATEKPLQHREIMPDPSRAFA